MQDKPGAKELQPSEAPSVEFDNVSFSYQSEAPVLKNVSFKVQGGQTLALVSLQLVPYRLLAPPTG